MTSPAGIPTPTDTPTAAALHAWAAAADPDNPAAALAAIVERVASVAALDVALRLDGEVVEPDPAVLAVKVDRAVLRGGGPWLPGFARETLLSHTERRATGVHHTSPAMAAALVAFVAAERPFQPGDRIVDPAVGGGAFLLAVAERCEGDRSEVLARLHGIDIDPLAVAVTDAALGLWAGGVMPAPGAIRVGDALSETWSDDAPDVVLGNPPFLSQLRGSTARDGERRDALAARWPELKGYVDDSVAFLLAAAEAVRSEGVVALVQPTSVLSSRDAEPARRRLLAEAPPVGMWVDGQRQFSAAVDTVTLVLRKGATPGDVRRARGVPAAPQPAAAAPSPDTWAPLLVVGAPTAPAAGEIDTGATLGEWARVTAGFRDEYYGLRGAVREAEADDDGPKLVTSGLIDPLTSRWGTHPCRFAKARWDAPVVVRGAVDPAIRGWLDDRLVPKLLVASQTKVLEAAIDDEGDMVPCTPVVTVEPLADAPSLAHLAAALTAPVISLLLLRGAAGSALSSDAMRVRAAALAALPLPPAGPKWDAAAAAVARLDGPPTETELADIGRLAMAAYGLSSRSDITKWWQSRLRRR